MDSKLTKFFDATNFNKDYINKTLHNSFKYLLIKTIKYYQSK